jgi:hypothetical protein
MTAKKSAPHVHAELIKAWADGAEIEYKNNWSGTWDLTLNPAWDTSAEYRLKPKKIVKKFRVALFHDCGWEYLVTHEHSCFIQEDRIEHAPNFLRWITGWIEY